MTDYTNNFSLPYPEGGNSVAVHTDIERLAKRADTEVGGQLSHHDNRIGSTEFQVGNLQQTVNTHGSDIAAHGGAISEIDRKVDGTYQAATQSAGNAVQAQQSANHAWTANQELIPRVEHIETMAGLSPGEVTDAQTANLISQPDTVTRQAADALYLRRNTNEHISADWTFNNGGVTEEERTKLAVERDFSTANGDLFDSKTRLEFSVRDQARTTQNPPGYSIAQISLVEDGDNDPKYQGESTYLRLVSNRLIMNKRLEMNMGSGHRATLSAGRQPGQMFARLHFHSALNPRFTLFGDENEEEAVSTLWSHATRQNGSQGVAVVEQAALRVESTQEVAFSVMGLPSQIPGYQELSVNQYDDGIQELIARQQGTFIGGLRFFPERELGIFGWGGIRMLDHVTFDRHIRIASSDGTMWRISVTPAGNIQATEV